MEKCSSYHITRPIKGWENSMTPIYGKEISVCWGTKECEECSCEGDKAKCNFYPELRVEAEFDKLKNSLDYKICAAISLLLENGYKVTKDR